MDAIAALTPDQARKLWHDYLSRQQLNPQLTSNYPQHRPVDEPSPHRVFVKNTTAEAIPAFACMQITGTAVYGERTVVNVTKPTTTDGVYLFNSPYEIASDAAGWAYRFGVVVMLGSPPSAAGAQYLPIVSSWEVEEGAGPFVVYGDYEITPGSTTAAIIGAFAGGGSGGGHAIWFRIVSVECVSSTETILTVEPTWYTGGCTKDIPGADPYTGYVTVEDVCSILRFYTTEWLESGDVVGRATYMYPRAGYCTATWLVDTICGIPDCA